VPQFHLAVQTRPGYKEKKRTSKPASGNGNGLASLKNFSQFCAARSLQPNFGQRK
jgi:hypothetical protein